MPQISAITVYCSSSSSVPLVYFDAARQLGHAIGQRKLKLVYGGNNVGCMGALADAVRASGGSVIGITPKLFVDKGIADNACHELTVCETMRERKALMEQRGDAYIALPGGIGTLEELFEILVAKQLRYHAKPIILLNVDNFFSPLLDLLNHGIEQKFIKPNVHDLIFVADRVDSAMNHLDTYQPPQIADKWFSHTPADAK